MTYVPHTHSYNEGGENSYEDSLCKSTSRVGITNLHTPANGAGWMSKTFPSQTKAGSFEPAVLLRLNLRVYSMPLEESQKSCPSKGRQKKNLLKVMEITVTRW
jgi:hypothetical protein